MVWRKRREKTYRILIKDIDQIKINQVSGRKGRPRNNYKKNYIEINNFEKYVIYDKIL